MNGTQKGKKPKVLAKVWKGTVQLSSRLKPSDGSIILHSVDELPIDSKRMNVGLLFILDPDEVSIKELLNETNISLPFTVIPKDDLKEMTSINPERILELTNDYITLVGPTPLYIDGPDIKFKLKEKLMEEISRTFFRIRRIEGVDRDYSSQMKEQIKMAVAQTIISAKDLHRLQGKRIKTIRPHLNYLFREIPTAKTTFLDGRRFLKGKDELDIDQLWELLSRFGNQVFIPIMKEVEKPFPSHPALPPVKEALPPYRDEKKSNPSEKVKSIFSRVLSENLRVRSSVLGMRKSDRRERKDECDDLLMALEGLPQEETEDLDEFENVE